MCNNLNSPINYYPQDFAWRDSVTRVFASGFFHKSPSPKPLKITLGSFRIFSKICGDIHPSQGASPGQRLWQICSWQILQPVPLMLLTPVANLPPVSAMGTLLGCRHLKVNLKTKIDIYVNSSTQRCPNKIIKIFWLKIFSICHQCQRHRWCTLNCEYLREFSEKFETALLVYSGACGKLIHEKSQKSRGTVPLNVLEAVLFC